MKTITKLWIWIILFILISPIGFMVADFFKAGAAWGEWGAEEMKGLVGYIPKGLMKLSGLWNAPIPDYAFKNWEEKGLLHLSFAYIISAAIGIAAVVVVILLLGRALSRK